MGHFEIYMTSRSQSTYESYLLTKGVPFAPLAPYFKKYLGDSEHKSWTFDRSANRVYEYLLGQGLLENLKKRRTEIDNLLK